MAEIVLIALSWIKTHLSVVIMGFLGACLSALLSKEKWTDRIVGALAGFILCIAFADHAAHILANGNGAGIFGFILGSMGKSTAETLLSVARKKLTSVVEKYDNSSDK